jgi:hypothetical protein
MRRGTAQVPAPAEPYHVPEYAQGYGDAGYADAPSRRRFGPWLVAAGAAVVAIIIVAVALGASGMFSGADDTDKPKPAAENAVTGTKINNPSAGYSTVVPNGWQRVPSNQGWQYGDPGDKNAWIRFNASGASGTAGHLLRSYGDGLRNNKSYQNYHQIALRQGVTMAGHNGAELEYTLVSNGQARHALWRAVIVDGTAYQVYLSVPAEAFDRDRAAYRNAVKAFRIG